MQRTDPNTGISIETKAANPGLSTAKQTRSPDWRRRCRATRPRPRWPISPRGLVPAGGHPAIICGPGSIEQAHKPDEYVTLGQVALCESFMERLLGQMCSG